ncbi:MAG: hypothetical protein OXE47_01435, partial [Gammaproteobacteria bacterium]|nr:hypothetical protein [Gammaproteobacteria bacterium]
PAGPPTCSSAMVQVRVTVGTVAEGAVAVALSRKSPAVTPLPVCGVQVMVTLSVGWPPPVFGKEVIRV